MTNNAEITGNIISEFYSIEGSVEELVAYDDLNFLFTEESGEKFIFKITLNKDDLEFIRSQNRILQHLAGLIHDCQFPLPVKNRQGEIISSFQWSGKPVHARLFPFIKGDFLAEVSPNIQFYRQLGKFFGRLDQALAGLEDPVLKSRTHPWDLARVTEQTEDLNLVTDPEIRRLVAFFLMKYREEVLPLYHKLPKGLIHGDGNDWNILVQKDQVAGLIDFGDMVYSARIQEPAIALAYAMPGQRDFQKVYDSFINGYRSAQPINELEERLLYYLIPARWCQIVLHGARKARENPDNTYHQISVRSAREMLRQWIRVNPSGVIRHTVPPQRPYFSKSLSLAYPQPIHMTGAAFQYMYSANGTAYLDCINNIPHVGHNHPKVVEAGQRQMARLNTNTRYLYEPLEQYATKLLSKFPPALNKVFFVNSGSAATDLAVRLAEAYAHRKHFVVLDHAYHGNTRSAISLSPYKFNRKGGSGKPDHVTILPLPPGNPLDEPSVLKALPAEPAAFFAESIPGCAGQVMLSKEYLQPVIEWVRANGGLYVADEVQTGFGRVGEKFWAFELYDVVPDIVILGKPMGNGHPMGAVVCTEAVIKSFETGMEFFSSFGGNPVSCAIGLAVLEVIEEEELQKYANRTGKFLKEELWKNRSAIEQHFTASGTPTYIADIRGSGFFMGIELVKDPETREPDAASATKIVNTMKKKGFLLSTDGPHENVIKIKPPMCFSKTNANELIENLIT
ncbi:MAG: aminotransferase class III-fold pyridoxal phosphate-dependent enzyme [Bacteroidales bacterium]|nr:aminotransferase class III-fold pyridoxal phosphate-dependent enzyme [Bacteroidales bacterium]